MIDFSKLSAPIQIIVPVRSELFRYNNKTYVCHTEDGWRRVEIKNNRCKDLGPDMPDPSKLDTALGYTHNNRLIFQNFDVALRKWNHSHTTELHFNQSPTFEAVRVAIWEDKRAYWVEPNYGDSKTLDLKDLLEAGKTLEGEKGITQELRSVFLFHALEREQLLQMQRQAEVKEEEERMMRDIPYRLNITMRRAGAELLNYSMSGNRIVVDWRVLGSTQRYNSVIDSRTWMVLEAGYCMSGDDRRHNLTSMIKTAELYAENRRTVITRSINDDPDENEDD